MMITSFSTIAVLAVAWQPTGIKWNSNSLPVPYCITANAQNTTLTANAQRLAVLDGILPWVSSGAGGSLSCTAYTAANATFSCRTGIRLNDQQPNIFWERNWRRGSTTIGVTWSVPDGTSCGTVTDDRGRSYNLQCKFDSDIELNDLNFRWDSTGTGNNIDVTSIMVHEYGHFIGLDHCDLNNTCQAGSAVMFSRYGGGRLRSPFTDDVQGACELYPGNRGGIGWPCTSPTQCTSNLCLNVNGDRFCSQTCGSCPAGFRCATDPNNSSRQVCLRDNGLNRAVCETCLVGAANACLNNGLCISGIPEQNQGRCVEPCGANNSCDAQFRCLAVRLSDGSTENFCFPRSSDCTDLANFTELQMGQRCDGDPPCAGNLTCVGICAAECTDGSACPSGYGCEPFQGARSFCLPLVDEGASCEGLVSCETGPCLSNPASGQFQCYRDCTGNPGICNNAQMCNTLNIGGQMLTVCEPPGVPPLPPDAGVVFPDAEPMTPDTGTANAPPDTGVAVPDAGFTPGVCTCDRTFDCDEDPANPGLACPCDPECNCPCDRTFACDDTPTQACTCDPECNCACDVTNACDLVNGQRCGCDEDCLRLDSGSSGGICACVQSRSGPTPWALGLLIGFVGLVVRRRVASVRQVR